MMEGFSGKSVLVVSLLYLSEAKLLSNPYDHHIPNAEQMVSSFNTWLAAFNDGDVDLQMRLMAENFDLYPIGTPSSQVVKGTKDTRKNEIFPWVEKYPNIVAKYSLKSPVFIGWDGVGGEMEMYMSDGAKCSFTVMSIITINFRKEPDENLGDNLVKITKINVHSNITRAEIHARLSCGGKALLHQQHMPEGFTNKQIAAQYLAETGSFVQGKTDISYLARFISQDVHVTDAMVGVMRGFDGFEKHIYNYLTSLQPAGSQYLISPAYGFDERIAVKVSYWILTKFGCAVNLHGVVSMVVENGIIVKTNSYFHNPKILGARIGDSEGGPGRKHAETYSLQDDLLKHCTKPGTSRLQKDDL